MRRLSLLLVAAVVGVLATALTLAGYFVGAHLLVDHQNLHALVNLVTQQQQQRQAPPSPPPPPAPEKP